MIPYSCSYGRPAGTQQCSHEPLILPEEALSSRQVRRWGTFRRGITRRRSLVKTALALVWFDGSEHWPPSLSQIQRFLEQPNTQSIVEWVHRGMGQGVRAWQLLITESCPIWFLTILTPNFTWLKSTILSYTAHAYGYKNNMYKKKEKNVLI